MATKKITNIQFDDIDWNDYPDFCDAYISAAEIDGIPATEEELNELNEDGYFKHQALIDYLF